MSVMHCSYCRGEATALIMMSVTATHSRQDGEKFRYNFSHIRSIASFLVLILNRFMPSSLISLCSILRAILREESLHHIKVIIFLISAFSIFSGISCA
jgi:hypothetical protein